MEIEITQLYKNLLKSHICICNQKIIFPSFFFILDNDIFHIKSMHSLIAALKLRN